MKQAFSEVKITALPTSYDLHSVEEEAPRCLTRPGKSNSCVPHLRVNDFHTWLVYLRAGYLQGHFQYSPGPCALSDNSQDKKLSCTDYIQKPSLHYGLFRFPLEYLVW